jgi:uncharacterized membrane protein YhaH (DUF805 family)
VSDVELKKTAERQTAQIIKRELDRKDYEETAWLKAFKKAKGNEEQARAIYVEIREPDLLKEVYISLKNKVDQRIAEVEWYRGEQNRRKETWSKQKEERKLSYENYAKRNNYSEAEKKKLLEKNFGKEDNANIKNMYKKEPPLTDFEKQQIKNRFLNNIESDTEDNFSYYIGKCFSKYATFDGVAGKSEFWWFYLIFTISAVTTYYIDINLFNAKDGVGLTSTIALLALFLPMTSVSSRRLHDIGKSGWWQLIAITGIGIFVLLFWYVSDSDSTLNKKYR